MDQNQLLSLSFPSPSPVFGVIGAASGTGNKGIAIWDFDIPQGKKLLRNNKCRFLSAFLQIKESTLWNIINNLFHKWISIQTCIISVNRSIEKLICCRLMLIIHFF